MEFALELDGLTKSVPVGLGLSRRTLLAEIDLALAPGRTLGLIGPNGSGKTTLLRLAAGVDRPTSGTVRIFGRSTEDAQARGRIGYLSERNVFPPQYDALETLAFLASLRRIPRSLRTDRARRALERAGLAAEARKPFARYSLGMHRRFGLAQAFFHDPELVLLDEPTSGLDAGGTELLDGLVRDARARGAALVISSHHPSDLLRLADEIAVLLDGRLAFRGTPADLVELERRARLDVEGLAPADLAALEAEVARRGGRVLASGPSEDSFLALYRRLGARTQDPSR
jgi:ABC-2 type transport system ATP-binding protein